MSVTDVDVVVGVDATAREESDRKVNCELTDGVTVSVCDVVSDVNVDEDVIVGKEMTPDVLVAVVVAERFPDAVVVVMVLLPVVVAVVVPLLDPVVVVVSTVVVSFPVPVEIVVVLLLPVPTVVVVPLPGAVVIVVLYKCISQPHILLEV